MEENFFKIFKNLDDLYHRKYGNQLKSFRFKINKYTIVFTFYHWGIMISLSNDKDVFRVFDAKIDQYLNTNLKSFLYANPYIMNDFEDILNEFRLELL